MAAQGTQRGVLAARTHGVPEELRLVPDLIVDYLVNEGVDTVFGVPGGAIIPLLAAFERSPQLRFVLAKHEGGAAFMADCHARVSGITGVCCATTGPGATNLLTGVAAAFADSIPMLVLTGMNPLDGWGRRDFQESTVHGIDRVSLFRPVTKSSDVVVHERQVQPRLRHALALARSGRPGPVHLALPRDLLGRKVRADVWAPDTFHPRAPAPAPEDLACVHQALQGAEWPLMILGGGVSAGAARDLCAVSAWLAIPMIATPRAKGIVSGCDAPYYLGTMGIAGDPRTDAFLAAGRCDVVLAVGAGFGSYATNSWDPALAQGRSIQVNIDPKEIGRAYPADLGIVSDAAAFAAGLRRLCAGPRGVTEGRAAARRAWLAPWLQPEPPAPDAVGPLLSPAAIVRAADAAVPPHGIILADSSSILLWATRYLPETGTRRFIAVWGAASMGHATAGAVGAQLAAPTRAVLALTGDGCFLMNGMEVATAADLGLSIVWVVNSNRQLGMIHYEQRASGLVASSEFGRCDFATIARGLGAHGVVCSDEATLAREIAAGFSRSGPTVIQVDVDPDPGPPLGQKKAGAARWQAYCDRQTTST